jgi:hypothetical protein
MWCEMGSCISRYAHPAALGEADTRARAIDAGWRIDAVGRLACPRCQQTDPGFWAASPVAVRDRDMAIARAARITAWPGDGTARSALPGSGRYPRRLGIPAAGPPEPRWHRQYPAAAEASPAAQASPADWPTAPQPVPPLARRDREPRPSPARLRPRPADTRRAGGHSRLTGDGSVPITPGGQQHELPVADASRTGGRAGQ